VDKSTSGADISGFDMQCSCWGLQLSGTRCREARLGSALFK
jgi:hypothetical protein